MVGSDKFEKSLGCCLRPRPLLDQACLMNFPMDSPISFPMEQFPFLRAVCFGFGGRGLKQQGYIGYVQYIWVCTVQDSSSDM